MSEIVVMVKPNKLLLIDEHGRLLFNGRPCEKPPKRFVDDVIRHTAIGGGFIKHWRDRSGVCLVQHTAADGAVTWRLDGTLTTLKDIDEARRVRREIDARA